MMVAKVFIQAKNLHCSFNFCPAFRDWLVERNGAGKIANIEKVANELHAGEDNLADRAAAQGEGFFLRPDEAVASGLQTVNERPRFVQRLGRVAA